GPDRLARGAHHRRHPHALAWAYRPSGRRAGSRFLDCPSLVGATALPLTPLAFDPVRLLRQPIDGVADGGFPAGRRRAKPGEKLLSGGVKRDVGPMMVLLACQDRLRRHGAVVQQPFELAEFTGNEPAQRWSDVDVPACEFESHTLVPEKSRISTAPSVD